MKRPAKKFALGTLAVSIIWILFEHLMGWNTTRQDIGTYTRNFPMIFFWIMLIVAIYYQRRGLGNTLTFREGFQTGLVMTLIFSLGFTIVIILYHKFLNPEMLSYMNYFTNQQLHDGKITQQEFENAMKENQDVYGGSFLSYLMLFGYTTIFGIGISALASLALMKK